MCTSRSAHSATTRGNIYGDKEETMADKAEITAAMLKALVSDFHGMTRSKLAASAKHPSHQAASAKQQTGRVGLREWLTEATRTDGHVLSTRLSQLNSRRAGWGCVSG
jgi:hypothetical protein